MSDDDDDTHQHKKRRKRRRRRRRRIVVEEEEEGEDVSDDDDDFDAQPGFISRTANSAAYALSYAIMSIMPNLAGKLPSTYPSPESTANTNTNSAGEEEFLKWDGLPDVVIRNDLPRVAVRTNMAMINFKAKQNSRKEYVFLKGAKLFPLQAITLKPNTRMVLMGVKLFQVVSHGVYSGMIQFDASTSTVTKKHVIRFTNDEINVDGNKSFFKMKRCDYIHENYLLDSIGLEPTLEELESVGEEDGQRVRYETLDSYFPEHGGKFMHIDSSIVRFLSNNRYGLSSQDNFSVSLYKVKDRPELCCFSPDQIAKVTKLLKVRLFRNISYINYEERRTVLKIKLHKIQLTDEYDTDDTDEQEQDDVVSLTSESLLSDEQQVEFGGSLKKKARKKPFIRVVVELTYAYASCNLPEHEKIIRI